MEGFLDMHSFQKYPLEESLKQAMIDHEILLKRQELHRLYAVQKSITKADLKYTFPERHLVGSTRFVLNDPILQQDQDLFSRFHRNPLDLRLSTGSSSEDDVLDGVEVNLSLSIGRSSNKRNRSSGNNWKNKIVYPSSLDIIDLEEESNETGSNENAQPVLSLDQSTRNSTDYLKIGLFNQGSLEQDDVKKTRVMNLDLNKDQQDDSFFYPNEPLEPHLSSDSSYGESCNKIGEPIKVSTSIPTLKQPKSAKDVQTERCCIDLESLPEPSSDLSEEKSIHISEVMEEKGKDDSEYVIRKAALSLISISLQETSSRNQDSETRSNEIENKKRTIPESSIDSYESLVLKLEESRVDEDCATSKAFEINEPERKENGIKLRRGTRMKDFQKDILPTISSLTRDEIWEDISLLEGVIRSREYKRMQKAKTIGKGENWFTPVRSKRSKVDYVGRSCGLRKKKPKLSCDGVVMK